MRVVITKWWSVFLSFLSAVFRERARMVEYTTHVVRVKGQWVGFFLGARPGGQIRISRLVRSTNVDILFSTGQNQPTILLHTTKRNLGTAPSGWRCYQLSGDNTTCVSDKGTKGPGASDVTKWSMCCEESLSYLLVALFTARKPKGPNNVPLFHNKVSLKIKGPSGNT